MTTEQALEKALAILNRQMSLGPEEITACTPAVAAQMMRAYADGMQEVFSSREMRFDEVKTIRAKADVLERGEG